MGAHSGRWASLQTCHLHLLISRLPAGKGTKGQRGLVTRSPRVCLWPPLGAGPGNAAVEERPSFKVPRSLEEVDNGAQWAVVASLEPHSLSMSCCQGSQRWPGPSCAAPSHPPACAGQILGFGADLSPDHPGFDDAEYKQRRVDICNLARTHRV